ncbi:prolipoprotein diacylglyceryl transferase family protein [Paraflavitalea sp. CAU 1676]|uniref:prolipoprotein diacylglyceryl transferase n=1 Tax=Paraflavitalea sp. CAU 1676 TaxID=3032598 RepID=UPI0023DBE823|nr:prolipoprotein diacylglyceryl transferase family protein [Paraflavitalea sp. CAU 1676]MDF2187756.1 prolipoprotein diacylglyceryl transferase [Paraflavitalea sp. CAU 1676]
MYPNLYYAFRDLFGVEASGLRFVNSFGFFVALSFLAAAWVLTRELKRKERAGLLTGTDVKIVVGKPATIGEILLNFILGFILGYKIVGLFLSKDPAAADPQAFIFSTAGNLPVGFVLGLLFAFIKWWEKNKLKLDKPEERSVRIWPHDRVGDLVIYAALFGFLGAKVFHNLENWNEFWASPIEALLSFSGLTFYGGLICAAVAIFFYARKHNIGFKHLCDAVAPGLMIAYAIGRIGCQVAGDGDWGILNSAYVTTVDSKVQQVDSTVFKGALQANSRFYLKTFQVESLDQVHHKSVKAPSWLPDWMVAYQYPHNVINEGVPIPGCVDQQYCNQLPIPVFPTPFYESVMGFLLFILLWSLRSKLKIPGTMFAVYLIVNGLERFFIEKIRVNTTYSISGFHPTQAELISSGLVIIGVALYFYLSRRKPTAAPQAI